MATGPEHYREAERINDRAVDFVKQETAAPLPNDELMALFAQAQMFIAAAQVHATLSLAAATAANIRCNGAVVGGDNETGRIAVEWSDAIRPSP
jgi:hypothetical protein